MWVIGNLIVGGAEHQLLHLLSQLDRQRFTSHIVTFRSGGALESDFVHAGVEVAHVERRDRWDVSLLWRLTKLLYERRADVVVTFLPPATLYGLLAARLARVPVRIATERGTGYAIPRWSHRIYMWLENLALRDSTLVIPNSEAGREFVLRRGVHPSKTRVIYNGLRPLPTPTLNVEEIRKRIGIPPGGPIVGMAASLTSKKDHRTFISAAAMVLEQEPSARFILVGEGPLRPQIEEYCKNLGITAYVRLVGAQSDISNWLNAFDIVVLSSVDREGCSNVLMEAQSLGKPVVATRIGGNVELVEDQRTGLLVPPSDPSKMASAILDMLNDPVRRWQMGEHGKQYVSAKFASDKYVNLWESTLESLVTSSRRD